MTETMGADARRTGVPDTPPQLLHIFATFDIGGPQVRTLEVARQLGSEFAHGFVAADGQTAATELLPARLGHLPDVFRIERPAGAAAQLRSLRRIVKRFRPDLILTYNWGAMLGGLAAITARIPFVHHEEVVPAEELPIAPRRRTWLRRRVLPRAAGVVCVGQDMRHRAISRWRVRSERCHLLPNGIDIRHHCASTPSPAAASDALVVGCIANARPEKNWPRLLRAFARLPHQNVRLLIGGDGPERAAANDLVKQLGIASRVEMAGTVADPAPLYRRMHVFALPSDREQHPLALLEAMAHGLPVVATDVGEVRASLPSSQQALVLSADSSDAAFAEQLARLLDEAALRRQLGADNRAHVAANFDIADVAARYRTLYQAAMRGAHQEAAAGNRPSHHKPQGRATA
ncbi:MAG: glycosyltransferase family 4 protein [Planctomycetota bacterium]